MLKGLAALATTFVLSMITLSWADAGHREANKISNLGTRHGHYYERYGHPPNYDDFSDYFRPFRGSYGGYYGGYFGSGSYTGFGDGYNPCGLGRSVLEGCRPYRGY